MLELFIHILKREAVSEEVGVASRQNVLVDLLAAFFGLCDLSEVGNGLFGLLIWVAV